MHAEFFDVVRARDVVITNSLFLGYASEEKIDRNSARCGGDVNVIANNE